MSPEALVTVFSVALAVYAIIPAEVKLDLRIRLYWIDSIVTLTGVLLIHYILLFPVLDRIGIAPNLGPWRWGFSPELTTYLIFAFMGVHLALRASSGRLRRTGIYKFKELTERLFYQQKHSALLFLIKRNWDQLVRIAQNRYWLPRLRTELVPPGLIDIEREERRKRWWYRVSTDIGEFFGRRLPDYKSTMFAANDTIRRVLVSDSIAREIAISDPYFGLEVLGRDIPQRHDFQGKWLSALLEERSSVLYVEIQNNENLSSGLHYLRYSYPSENRILHFYFSDVEIAHDLGVTGPATEWVFDFLDNLFRQDGDDPYNQPLGYFFERHRWKCPIHATIRLYEFASTEALYQGYEWHMWLYDLFWIVKRIERNISPSKEVEMNAEWPTPYHYLLYSVVEVFLNCINGAEGLEDQKNCILQSKGFVHENGNLPKSAAMAISYVLDILFQSESVGQSFKAYIFEIVFKVVIKFESHSAMAPFSNLLLESLCRNGFSPPDKEKVDYLHEIFPYVDIMLRKKAEFALDAKIEELSNN